MRGHSISQPQRTVDLKPGFQIRWNIQQVIIDDEESFTFDFNTVYIPYSLTEKEITLAIIRERYDYDDEIALSYQRPGDEQKLLDHEAYVQFAKDAALIILGG